MTIQVNKKNCSFCEKDLGSYLPRGLFFRTVVQYTWSLRYCCLADNSLLRLRTTTGLDVFTPQTKYRATQHELLGKRETKQSTLRIGGGARLMGENGFTCFVNDIENSRSASHGRGVNRSRGSRDYSIDMASQTNIIFYGEYHTELYIITISKENTA